MSTYNRFAYGYDTVDDCPCPAIAAGFNPSNDDSTEIAEYYDSILKQKYGNIQGTITEEQAKKAWFQAIEQWESKYEDNEAIGNGPKEIGEQIAQELGWL